MQSRRPLQQVGYYRRGIEDLLEVIEHDQHVTAGQAPAEGVDRLLPALPDEAERRGDDLRHQPGIGDRRQVDERDAVCPVRPAALGHGQRQPRLADPPGTSEDDQAAVLPLQQPVDLTDITVPAHQCGDR